jgi:hypothetical protein
MFGPIAINRHHFRCPSCQESGYTADALLGLDGYLSPRVLRLACRLSADHSFETASERLAECCNVIVSDETLRRHSLAEGTAVAEWLRTAPQAMEPFQAAAGEVEVQVDAGKVNTTLGWRDLKVIGFAKRPLGAGATSAEWISRKLPPTTARAILADIEEIETFRYDWRTWADRLGIGSGPAITVLGDGAEWIWNAANAQFPQCRQVLDIYHALEYLSDAAKALYGPGSAEAQASYAAAEHELLVGGWQGVCRWVAQELALENTDARQKAVEPVVSYLSKHVGRLDYLSRLTEGRSIGSGMIEGSIKTLGLRMKARGARWIERNAEKMSAMVGLSQSTTWDLYWSTAA